MRRPSLALAACAAAAVAAGAVSATAQEPPPPPLPAPDPPVRYRLAHRVSQGLVYTVELLRTKRLTYTFAGVKGGEGSEKTVPAEVDHAERTVWTDTFRTVSDGAPRRIERHYHVQTAASYIRTTDQRTSQRRPLHGRSVVLQWHVPKVIAGRGPAPPPEWRITAHGGKPLPAAEAGDVRPLPLLAQFLPRRPVAVGDTWTLDGAAVQALVQDRGASPVKVGKAWGKLTQVVHDGGRRLARIEIGLAWAGTHRGLLVYEAALGGPIVFDLGAERLIRADLSGTLKMETREGAPQAGRAGARLQGPFAIRLRVLPGRTDAGPPSGQNGRRGS